VGSTVSALDRMKISVAQDAQALTGAPHSGSTAAPQLGPSRRMQAVGFDGCFGWLHQATESIGGDTAVLLCAGLGRDASTAHRSFRLMADSLAGAGYPTLRFDYPGTGDSGEVDGTECWTAWQRSIQAAVDWLRDSTGARRIVMIGLRIGATLAALAASTRDDIAALVLLEPVLRGKSYVNQLTVEARLRNSMAAASDDSLTVADLDAGTVGSLRQVDLRQATLPPGCAMLICSQFRTPVLAACLDAWRDTGAPIACENLTGLEPLLRPCHLTDGPVADVTPILSWLRNTTPPRRQPGTSAVDLPNPVMLQPPDCIETPLRFSERQHLFGMLCRPAGDKPCDLAVIIGNTGGDPHHGFARFAVEFARRLAIQGIASLRIDFAGLGDSICPADGGEGVTQVFEVDRTADCSAAIDTMQQLGFRRFALHGLCSGAYHALLGAVADDRVSMLLPINLPWFTLRFQKPGPSSFARHAMAALSRRKVRSLLLFSAGDPGIKELEKHFGPQGIDLHDTPGAVASIVAGLDHDLTGSAMRQIAADSMIDFLLQGPAAPNKSLEVDDDTDLTHALVARGI
jgi:pimeloyl-ACP methyl ester carboxylesterase